MSRAVSFVVFTLGRTEYAVPIHRVESIIASTDPTKVPGTGPHTRGAYKIRGRVVPIVNLRSRLGMEPRSPEGATGRVLVVNAEGRNLGIEVDEVSEVLSIDPADIQVAQQQVDDLAGVSGILRLEGRRVTIADIDALVAAEAA